MTNPSKSKRHSDNTDDERGKQQQNKKKTRNGATPEKAGQSDNENKSNSDLNKTSGQNVIVTSADTPKKVISRMSVAGNSTSLVTTGSVSTKEIPKTSGNAAAGEALTIVTPVKPSKTGGKSKTEKLEDRLPSLTAPPLPFWLPPRVAKPLPGRSPPPNALAPPFSP
jgi:hypothetical protein